MQIATIEKKYLLIFLWIFLTLININKAFHMDDVFHLEASKHILENPLSPNSGFINWKDIPTPIYSHNQPALFFYIISFIAAIFGYNEIPLHLMLSLFTFLTLYYFQKCMSLFQFKSKNTILILFAFNSSLIINQNLMTDIPILSFILIFTYNLLKAVVSNKNKYYLFAAISLSIGVLIKYTVIPLFIVFIIVLLINQKYNQLKLLVIPIITITLWSLWNYFEYNSIHILDRPKRSFNLGNVFPFMACLGAISCFSTSLIFGYLKIKNKLLHLTFFSLIALIIISDQYDVFNKITTPTILNYIFFINGFTISIIIALISVKKTSNEHCNFIKSKSFILLLVITSLSSFIILFAPFIATRHILLVVPFVLLFLGTLFDVTSKTANVYSMIFTVILGIALGISDWKYADFYRRMAKVKNISSDNKTWTKGHWGWQWYSEQAGMAQYKTGISNVKIGDSFIFPGDISSQNLSPNIGLTIHKKIWEEADFFTYFSGKKDASLYGSSKKLPPWSFSTKPIDTIYICTVSKITLN